MKTTFLILMNIFFSILIGKLIFRNFKNFKRALYYIIYPDIISIIKKDYNNDFNYTHRMLAFVGILLVLLLIEIKLFY